MPTPRKMKSIAILLERKKGFLSRINVVFLCVLFLSIILIKVKNIEYFGLIFAVSLYVVFVNFFLTFTRWSFHRQHMGNGLINSVLWFFHPLDMYYVGESHIFIQWLYSIFLSVVLLFILVAPLLSFII